MHFFDRRWEFFSFYFKIYARFKLLYLYPQHSKAVHCTGSRGYHGNGGYHGYQVVTVVTIWTAVVTLFLVELDLAPSFEWVFNVFRMDIFIRGLHYLGNSLWTSGCMWSLPDRHVFMPIYGRCSNDTRFLSSLPSNIDWLIGSVQLEEAHSFWNVVWLSLPTLQPCDWRDGIYYNDWRENEMVPS